jgi:TRAP-type C4-dicarboxylate transport system permease small subunit
MAQYLMGVVVAGGVAYCAIKKGHTVVEILIERMTNTGRNIVNAITFFLSAVFVGIASWRLIDYTVSTYQSGLRSSVLPIPTFPFMAFVTLCFWIFSLVFLAISLEYIRNIEGKK